MDQVDVRYDNWIVGTQISAAGIIQCHISNKAVQNSNFSRSSETLALNHTV